MSLLIQTQSMQVSSEDWRRAERIQHLREAGSSAFLFVFNCRRILMRSDNDFWAEPPSLFSMKSKLRGLLLLFPNTSVTLKFPAGTAGNGPEQRAGFSSKRAFTICHSIRKNKSVFHIHFTMAGNDHWNTGEKRKKAHLYVHPTPPLCVKVSTHQPCSGAAHRTLI